MMKRTNAQKASEAEASIAVTRPSADYELLDSGEGEKLERFGQTVLSRPDPQALWHKSLDAAAWKRADGHFSGDWRLKPYVQAKWEISFAGLKLWVRPSSFKHVGLFPEQESNWKWMQELVGSDGPGSGGPGSDGPASAPEVLNLFGYTGGATLSCAKAGAKVVHVDGSKAAMGWARENAELSGLAEKPVRWILDDARAFVRREAKRGRRYDGIVMDPPAFGHGPGGELWKIEEHLLPLIDDCMQILKDEPLFFLINGYSAGYSALAYENALLPLARRAGGKIEAGELSIEESGPEGQRIGGQSIGERLLPAGIFARWSK